MKTIWQRLKGRTPAFFRKIAILAYFGMGITGGLLCFHLPHSLHVICTHLGAVCAAIALNSHLTTTDEPKRDGYYKDN